MSITRMPDNAPKNLTAYPNVLHQVAHHNDLTALKALLPVLTPEESAENSISNAVALLDFKLLLSQEDYAGRRPIDCAAVRGHLTMFNRLHEQYQKSGITLNETLIITIRAFINVLEKTSFDYQQSQPSTCGFFPHGKVNEDKRRDKHFMTIIQTILETYPDSVKETDKYKHTALFYAAEFCIRATQDNNAAQITIARELIQQLKAKDAHFLAADLTELNQVIAKQVAFKMA